MVPNPTPPNLRYDTNERYQSSLPVEMIEPDAHIESLSPLAHSPTCEECETLLENMDEWAKPHHCVWRSLGTKQYQFHGTIRLRDAIQKASDCHLCYLVHELFGLEEQKRPDNELAVVCAWTDRKLGDIQIGRHILKTTWNLPHRWDVTRKFGPVDWEESKSSTWSPGAMETASNWLNDCITNHRKCSKGQSQFMPSRLLDIGITGTITPRLISTAGHGFTLPQRYISLSHCWGDNVSISLTHANITSMADGIRFQDLPKTFQHALTVTRDLKCRYIWIDSLCIIQDSHEDWLQESAQMHRVYSNSYVNIAASAASNSTKGLFFSRNLNFMLPLVITIGQASYSIDPPPLDINAVIEKSPLNCRAWVYQERFLSRRTLHFTASQLFWECKMCSMCESNPEKNRLTLSSRLYPRLLSHRLNKKGVGRVFATFELWNEVVRDYSRCKLTKETDRLVAISGVAASWLEITSTDDEYLAGIWRKTLPYSLLWEVTGERSPQTSYIAPSWSWASVLGQAQVPFFPGDMEDVQDKSEVLDAKVQLAGPGRFGLVHGGVITIKAMLMRIPLWVCQKDNFSQPNACEGCKHDEENPDKPYNTHNLLFTLDIPRLEIDQRRRYEGDPYLHFPISTRSSRNKQEFDEVVGLLLLDLSKPHGIEHHGLLLQATGGAPGEFRRIGTFSENWTDFAMSPSRSWRSHARYLEGSKGFKTQAERLGVQCCEDKYGATGEYIVTIV